MKLSFGINKVEFGCISSAKCFDDLEQIFWNNELLTTWKNEQAEGDVSIAIGTLVPFASTGKLPRKNFYFEQGIARYEDTSKFHEGSPGYFDFEAKWNENRNKILAELHTSSEPNLLKKNTASAESFIAFKNVTVLPVNRPPLFNISFSAKSGEITLIRGHLESGLETLENLITGMEENPCRGTVTLSSNCGIFQKTAFSLNLAKKRLNPAMLRGKNSNITAIIPSDRTFRSSNPTLTIEQLLTVYYTGKDTKAYAEKIIKKAQVAIKTEEKA